MKTTFVFTRIPSFMDSDLNVESGMKDSIFFMFYCYGEKSLPELNDDDFKEFKVATHEEI